MSLQRKKNQARARRAKRVRAKLRTVGAHVRICVSRSLKHFYAQVVDDRMGKTVVSCSTLELEGLSGDKKAWAKAVGTELAKRMQKAGIESGALDRGRFLYHGRVKAFTEGVREGGIKV